MQITPSPTANPTPNLPALPITQLRPRIPPIMAQSCLQLVRGPIKSLVCQNRRHPHPSEQTCPRSTTNPTAILTMQVVMRETIHHGGCQKDEENPTTSKWRRRRITGPGRPLRCTNEIEKRGDIMECRIEKERGNEMDTDLSLTGAMATLVEARHEVQRGGPNIHQY